jgi:coenzyme F420-0:L-glutamate ligase/coenzyme F420-1:gamma-L-glutamate ligase
VIRARAIGGLPEVRPGDDLAALIAGAEPGLGAGDVVVIAHKVVSKAEGRIRVLADIEPGTEARALADRLHKDARQVQAVLDETSEIVRDERVLICRTRHGFVCANAGVDASNVAADVVVLLPADPDESARAIQATLEREFNRRVAVVVSDTFGRPWREGITNVAIGVAGIAPLIDYRGKMDTHGRPLKVTVIAIADELASAAELVMQKTAGLPVVIIRGFTYATRTASARELIRPAEIDLFR